MILYLYIYACQTDGQNIHRIDGLKYEESDKNISDLTWIRDRRIICNIRVALILKINSTNILVKLIGSVDGTPAYVYMVSGSLSPTMTDEKMSKNYF